MTPFKSVDIYTFTYNDSVYVERFVEWYSSRFKNVTFHILDNFSTDHTVDLSRSLGCIVTFFGAPGQFSISIDEFSKLRGECFQESKSDYVLICDIDEFLDVSDWDLFILKPVVVQARGFHVLGDGRIDFREINRGVYDSFYDKCMMFRKSVIRNVTFAPGAHTCELEFYNDSRQRSIIVRNMFHFRWLSLDHVIERYARNAKRISPADRAAGYAVQYFLTKKEIEAQYLTLEENATSLAIYWKLTIWRHLNLSRFKRISS